MTTVRGEKTKEKILNAALTLFAAKGYKATTVRDVAAKVGIKQSALYNHYNNKEAILYALIERLTGTLLTQLFDETQSKESKALLMSIASKFKLVSFDKSNEALFRLLMQELYRNPDIRNIYLEKFYQDNVKKLSGHLFSMMQEGTIKSGDPLLLAHEFFAPLFFYQSQVTLLKLDRHSTSSVITLFEKHVEHFWECIKAQQSESLF